MKNKFFKFISTVLVAILIISIAPMNDAVVSEMKSSANSVIKNFGDVVENIDFTLSEFDVKAEAADSFTYSYSWDFKTNTLTITGSGNMLNYDKTASPWDGYKNIKRLIIKGDITSIGNSAFKDFINLEEVVIEAPITYINGYAFQGCSSLENITLPNTLKSIYKNAFKDCISLKGFVIPDSVTKIFSGVFEGCYLESLTTPFVGGGPDNTSETKTDQLGYMFGTTEYENTYSVKSKADKKINYYIPYSLKSVTITKNLYKYNFYNCIGIEEIIIADTVTSTGYANYFAYGCTSLKKVVTNTKKFNNGVGAAAFQKCSVLESFIIPDSIKWIGEDAFNECTSLSSVTVPSGDFYIRLRAFDNTPFWEKQTDEFVIMGDGVLVKYNGTDTNVIIPEGVKRICCAFENRSDILSIQLPADLKYISSDSFYGCLGITELVVPDSVVEIDVEAFDGMCNLERLTIPFIGKNRDVKTDTEEALIGYWFDETTNKTCNTCNSEYCVKRTQYYNSNKYTRIFYQPKKLKTLVITDSIIRSWCLKNFFIDNMTIGANVDGIEKSALYNSGIDYLYFEPLISIDELPDNAFSKNSIKEVVLPPSIKKLGSAFVDNPLISITLNEGLEEIDGAFEGTKIPSIEFPSTLKRILGSAFEKCKNISEINIGKNIEEISSTAFLDTNIKGIYVDEENQNYFDEAGILYDKNGVLVAYPSGNTSDTYYIGDKVTLIPNQMLDQFVNIAKFVVDENNENYFSCDGVLYNNKGYLIKYPNKKNDTIYVIDNRVKDIPYLDSDYITQIEAVVVAEDNPKYKSIDGVLYNKDVTDIIWYPQKKTGDYTALETVEKVRAYAFYRTKIGKLEFPEDVEFIYECFYQAEMKELIAVNLPNGLYYYFGYHYMHSQPYAPQSLKRVVLTNQTSNLDDYFAMQFNFEEIEINGSFTHIGDDAFNITCCKEIVLPDTVEYIGERAFSQSDFQKIYLGKSLKYIADEAFYVANYLCDIELPATVEYIGDIAFALTSITEINLGDNITYIGSSAFSGSKLKRATISENLVDISDKIFLGCEYLVTIVVGGSVESIGEEAFGSCTALETVVLPNNVVEISDDAFLDANEDLVIYCNEGSYAEQYAIANEIKYTTLVIDPIENQTYTGKEITPEVNASANNIRLTQNEEYTISYKDNINAGSAKVIAKGLGDFKHLAATARFTILPKGAEEVTVLDTGSVYTPKGVTPKLYVYSGNKLLVEGQDYEMLENRVLTDAGEYNLAVSLIGNYDGIINATYKISRKPIAKTNIEYGDIVTITYKGVTLEEGKDYIVTKETTENGDEVTTVKGIGNYSGTDSYTKKANNQHNFNWFENLINAIRRLFESLFNISV